MYNGVIEPFGEFHRDVKYFIILPVFPFVVLATDADKCQ
jgi:hypothetical protein